MERKVIHRGIDVSKHNGTIDWQAVAESGVTFAIIRAGWSWYEGGLSLDSCFQRNIAEAQAAGLLVGVYLYAYDLTPQAARISAQKLAALLQPYRLDYPVYYDQEYEAPLLALSTERRTAICKAFLEELSRLGYYAGLYASADWLQNKLHMRALADYTIWVAQYASQCSYSGDYGIWQHSVIGSLGVQGKDYTVAGRQAGVVGNCDQNKSYLDYPAIIRAAGLNGWTQQSGGETQPDTGETQPELGGAVPELDETNWEQKYKELAQQVEDSQTAYNQLGKLYL